MPSNGWHINRRRLKAFLAILGLIYALAFLAGWIAIIIPFIGGPLFLAALLIWHLPSLLFGWTGYFQFHEFGGQPNGWQGHVIMFAFYAGLAALLSLPFGRKAQ